MLLVYYWKFLALLMLLKLFENMTLFLIILLLVCRINIVCVVVFSYNKWINTCVVAISLLLGISRFTDVIEDARIFPCFCSQVTENIVYAVVVLCNKWININVVFFYRFIDVI